MKLTYYTSVDGVGGYGVQGFKYADELAKRKNVDMRLMTNGKVDKAASPELMECLRAGPRWEGDVCLVNGIPYTWSHQFGERFKKFCGYTVFEGDVLPAAWPEMMNDERVDLVFVPSNPTKEVFIKSGVKEEKVKVVPHGVDPEVFKPDLEPFKIDGTEGKFKFLYIGGLAAGVHDRKGVDVLLKAFSEEFKKEEDVCLVLKINKVYNPNFNTKLFIDNMCGKDRAPIALLENNMSPNDLARLYNSGDCFVMPTRGEAYGMPIAEASACGLPVIVTKNQEAGYMDFTDEIGAYYCETKGKIQVNYPINGILYDGTKWVEPDLESLKKQMRWVFENQDTAKVVGKAGSHIIRTKHTWQKAVDKMIEYMEE